MAAMRTLSLVFRSRSPGTISSISLAAFAVIAGLAVPGTAHAQAEVDRATARTLGQDGEKALAAKDFKKAEDDFRRADSLVHAPTLLLGLARALAGEGRYVEASETYKRIVREGVAPGGPAAFQKAVDAAGQEVQDISPKIGAVTITVKGADGAPVPGVTVTFDGTPVNAAALGVKRPADPGSHTVHAAAAGYKAADATVSVTSGGSSDAPITLDKDPNAAVQPPPAGPAPGQTQPPTSAPPTQSPSSGGGSILPWVAFGVGGAGLIVGGVTGVMAISKHSDLSGQCSGGTCPPSQSSNLDSYHTLGVVSTVGFIVAGVGAATGVTLLLLQPKGASDSAASASSRGAPAPLGELRVTPYLGIGSVGAIGTF